MSMATKCQKLYSISPIRIEYWDYYGKQLSSGEGYEVKEIYSKEQAMIRVRNMRNELLANTDWTQFPDVPISEEMRQKWQQYRQELRDYPSRIDVEEWIAPAWPIEPTEG